ncbi:hypothetical protein J7L48_04245 [bacterium]|nr:hypothetical protein [bacterium]
MKKFLTIFIIAVIIALLAFTAIFFLRSRGIGYKDHAFLYNKGTLMKERSVEIVDLENITEININSTLTTINLRHSETEAKEIQIIYWNKKEASFSFEKKDSVLNVLLKKDGIIEEISGNIGNNININIYSNKSKITLTGLNGGNILFQCNDIFVNMKDLKSIVNFTLSSENSSLEYNNCDIQSMTGNLGNTHLFFKKCSIDNLGGNGNGLYVKINDCNFSDLDFKFLSGFLNINNLVSEKLSLEVNNSRIVVFNSTFQGGKITGENVYLDINNNSIDRIKLKLLNSYIKSDTSLKNRIDLDTNVVFYTPKK